MLQKAIIEKKLDKYSMKVRIPVYNKVKSDPTATPTNELYTATIQTLPGCSPNYQEGDVVIVDFENDDLSFPIIIGLLYREGMPEGSTDITADSLVVNVNTNLSENTLIGEVTPDSLKKLNDKYSNNVKAISIQYSLSNYQDHYDSFSNWSEQAPQYWPGKFMWQRTTVTYEDGTIMRSMTCIQGAQGSAGSGATIEETYVKYAISSNGTTPPDITQSGIWFPNPPKTTDVNPYLWSWTYTRFSDGKTNSAFGVSRVSTNSAIVYLYKRSVDEITAIDWTENLTYDFDNKKLTAAPAGWSEEIPSGSEPLYVTAATASSITAQATILPAEWSIPTLFSTSGLNSKTVLLYKRYGSTPATPSTAVTYTFSTGAIQPTSPDGWSLTIPNTDGNPCYVTQATAIGYGDTYTIQKNSWSAPTVLAKDGNSDYIDQPVVDWYIVTNNTNTPTSPTADIEVETEWTDLGWTQDMSSLELSASNKYLWNAEVTHYTISGYIKTSPHIITTFAETGKGIQDIEDKFALNNDPENPPAKGSAVWGDNPITPTPQNKYLWKYEIIHYTTGDSKETTPTVISMYSAPGEEGAPGLSAAAVFLYQRAASASSITKPTGTLTYTFATGTLSGQLGGWKQSIPASDGNPCFVIQATAIGTGETDTISPSEWSSITELVSDGKNGTDGKDGEAGIGIKTTTIEYAVFDNGVQFPQSGWQADIPEVAQGKFLWTRTTIEYTNNTSSVSYSVSKNGVNGTDGSPGADGVGIKQTTISYVVSDSGTDIPQTGWKDTIDATGSGQYLWTRTVIEYTDDTSSTSYSVSRNGTNGIDGKDGTDGRNSAVVYLYKRADSATIDWTNDLIYNFDTKSITNVPKGWYEEIPSGTAPIFVTAATASSNTSNDSIPSSEWATPVILAQNGQNGQDGAPGTDGTNGLNTASIFLYKRASTDTGLTKPTVNLTYTFATGELSGNLAGWSRTIPASDGNPCFSIQATAVSSEATDTILPSEWSSIVKLVEDGAPGQNGTDGKDGTDGTNGVNTAIVYLYKRSATTATINWTTTLTYNFTTKKLTTVPTGWSSTIPSGTDPLYVTAATAASVENTDTITPDEWATPVILVQNGQDGADGTSITAVLNYYLATNVSTGVTRDTEGWTTDIQTISSDKPYLWNYEEVKYSNTVSTYTDPCIIGAYGSQGEPGSAGVGITSIVEYYALSATTTRPTTGWSTNLPSMDATNRYLWNYSVITYTNGDTSGSVTDALIIGVYGDSVLSVEIQADNGTLFNAKAMSTTLSADVYLGVKQLTVSATGVVKDGATTIGQLNWFAKERFTGNGTSTTFDLGLDILNATTSPKVEITINGTTTTEFTVVDKDTIKFNTAPADESIILIQYLTSTSDKVTVTRTDVRGQVVIICKVVSSSKTLTLSEVTIKDLNDTSSLKSWYMLTVDNVTFVSAPTVVYDENDSSVVPTGEYKNKVGDAEEVTVSFTWQDSAPIVNSGTVSKLCYTFQMIIFSDNSCTAGNVERSAAFDAGVVSWLQAQEAKDAADNAQSSADNAQNTANDALDGTHQNAENIQHVQQTLTAIDGVLAAKLDTVTFTPYKENIDSFMQFDIQNSTMTLGKGNFKQQMSPTKNSFMEGSTEVAYISNQELYINNATVNNKLSLDEQWVITFDSSSGLIIKHI
jgi:hypothetical protein